MVNFEEGEKVGIPECLCYNLSRLLIVYSDAKTRIILFICKQHNKDVITKEMYWNGTGVEGHADTKKHTPTSTHNGTSDPCGPS